MIKSVLAFIVTVTLGSGAIAQEQKVQPMPAEKHNATWSLVIHGGAGVLERELMTPQRDRDTRAALNRALEAGTAVLEKGGASIDAVAAAIMVLEDDPNFNAGRGSVFTYKGRNEMDAAIMDGRDRSAGAVAGVTTTKNPILLARAVKDESPHVLLARDGANEFSVQHDLEQVDSSYFATDERLRQLEELKARKEKEGDNNVSYFDIDMKYGTVGAVALDQDGNVAAGTSTGGLTGKRWGRIGDSPIIGAGTYADNRACAISATGAGEFFIRLGIAHEICARMRFANEDAKTAADHVIAELGEMGGTGGVIVAAPDGTFAWSYNTPGMYRGKANSDGVKLVGIYGDEE